MTVSSPCISICQIDPETGNCSGCYRSREEIARWPMMSADERAKLLQALKKRRSEKTGLHARQNRRRQRKRV